MSKTSGMVVTYTDLNGKLQKGIVRYSDQHKAFKKANKALIRLCNDDLSIKKDQDKKALVALKSIDLLTHIGYSD